MIVVAEAFRPIATMFPCKGYPLIDGRLAQRLERSPHTREVKGSNPLSPTIPRSRIVYWKSLMTTLFRTIEFLSLSLWLGADAFLSFVVAPGAFTTLGNRDAAGMMVGYSLARLHFAGIFLGLVFLLARLARTHDFGSFTSAAALCVVLMALLTGTSQFTVSNRMEALKKEMVSVQNTPETDPRRVEFNGLHYRSVAFEGVVLLLGFAGMYLLVRETIK